MTKRILVTGVNGFVGHHVAEQLHKRGVKVVGIGNQPNIQPDVAACVNQYICCDLTNPQEVSRIDLSEITAIINLAGFASVGDSKGRGEIYNHVNVGVHTVLYEECLRQKVSPRIVAVSTGAVYDSGQPLPITETSKVIDDDKTNEYVVSKKLMEVAVKKFITMGLRCVIARPFNHTGPGQLPGFLLPDLYEQILEAQKNNQPIMVGNIRTKRDFTDVRDVARAYIELATCNEDKLSVDLYNICSGESVSGEEILRILTSSMGIESLTVEVDETKIRPNEVMDIYGSAQLIESDIGWSPKITIDQTIKDFVSWNKEKS